MASKFFCLALLVLVTAPLACSQDEDRSTPTSGMPAIYALGDVRNCPVKSPQDESQPLYQMEVLPGIGFDNLRNLDMGQIHALNFSSCQVSKDGRFLLPDSIFLIPVQESKVEVYAEYFDHWDNYTSMTSNSINLDASFFSVVSGKFSSGYSRTKSHMYNDQAKSTRIQIRNKRYTVKLQPGATLHPVFKSRVYDIAANVQNNNTEYAHYLAELMIRDYGTHYVSSIDAGAILSQVDFVKSSSVDEQTKYTSHITASASANFFGKVKLSTTFQHSSAETNIDQFVNNRTYSQVITVGGPPFTPNLTLTDWEKGVDDALVAIDRSGDPLHFVINPVTLPRLPETTVRTVADILRRSINRYYKINTRTGCTDPDAANFNFNANLDDLSCKPPSTNFTFGGVYQKCTVDSSHATEDLCNGGPEPAKQLNPLTGDLSCPPDYTAVHLHSGMVSHVVQKPQCNKVCHHCGWFSRCCHCESVLTPFLSMAHYDTYWCAALTGVHLHQNEGYLFGGFYSSKASNPVTGAMTCPRFFYPVLMGEDTKVCVSTDYERGYAFAVDFAGFESCSMGNPLADSSPNDENQANWPHTCPHGYAQHLVMVEDGCEINFCVRAGAFRTDKLAAPKLPPFRKHPKYKENVTETLAVFGVNGEIWVKNDDGGWDEVRSGSPDGQALLKRLDPEHQPFPSDTVTHNLSSGTVAALSILSTLVLGLLIVIATFMGRRAVKALKQRRADGRNNYMAINDSADGGGTTSPLANPTAGASATAEPV